MVGLIIANKLFLNHIKMCFFLLFCISNKVSPVCSFIKYQYWHTCINYSSNLFKCGQCCTPYRRWHRPYTGAR